MPGKLKTHKVTIRMTQLDHDGKTVEEEYEITYDTVWHNNLTCQFEVLLETLEKERNHEHMLNLKGKEIKHESRGIGREG